MTWGKAIGSVLGEVLTVLLIAYILCWLWRWAALTVFRGALEAHLIGDWPGFWLAAACVQLARAHSVSTAMKAADRGPTR